MHAPPACGTSVPQEVVKHKKAKQPSKSVQPKELPPVRGTLPSPIIQDSSRELHDPESLSEGDGFVPQPQTLCTEATGFGINPEPVSESWPF